MSSSSVLLIVVVAALCCFTTAQVCIGANMTLNVNSASSAATRCPYGYVSYASEGRCLTYRQLVNNFLYASCNIDSDCGPLATNPSHIATSGQFMICGTQKVCTWAKSRALGDECSVNANCFSDYIDSTPSSFEPTRYGCAKSNNTCVRARYVYTAGLNERCNYQDRDEIIRCDPTKYSCSDVESGSCRARREIGQACGTGYTDCVLNAYCNATTNVCDPQRQRGNECNSAIINQCSQDAGTTRCIQNVCSALRNLNEQCSSSLDCSTAADVNAFCHVSSGLCAVPATLGQNCNSTYVCQPNLKCVSVDSSPLSNKICVNYAGNNETCGSGQFDNICANNFTCVRGRCSANGNGDPCTFDSAITANAAIGNCNQGLVCIGRDVCVPRVSVGGNCSRTDLLCLDNLYCTNFGVGASVSLNRTCVAYQQRGQACDPGTANPALNPLNPLRCNTTLNCARGVCIEKYTLSEGAFCAQSTDCDTGFCDPMFKQCSRRKMCTTSGAINLGGTPYQCDCICSAGKENLGRCILDLCERQKQELTDCMNFNFRVNFQKSYLTQTFAFLDSQSSFYKKCEYQHQQYVNCQGYMSKLSAPAVALGDAINYNLAGINGANTMSTSLMVVVAAVVSLVLML